MQQLLPRATFDRRYVISPSLGDAAQGVQVGAGIATPVVTGALATWGASAAATGATADILGMSMGLAIPIVGAAIAGVTLAVVALLRSGCGQSCVITSRWAEDAERVLQQNIQAYFSIPGPRTRLQQRAALENVDKVIGYLFQQCSQVPGRAGENCINDRKAGACKWKQTSDSPLLKYPGEPQPGECWNWLSGYRDPIANDPNVTDPPPETTAAMVSALAQTDTGVGQTLNQVAVQLSNVSPVLLIGAGLLIVGLMGGKK